MSKILVIDIETTGLNVKEDEILQISIIDGDGEVKLNEYCKPEHVTSWDDAAKINHITKEMVEHKYPFRYYVDTIRRMIIEADTIITFNGINFDILFLEEYGISFEDKKQVDVMYQYKELYGKVLKLEELAKEYGYPINAHDALSDTEATLFIYKKLKTIKSNIFFERRKIDFILNNSNRYDRAKDIASKSEFKASVSNYGDYVGITTHLNNYNQSILFGKNNLVYTSHCTCMDCLEGGNRLCKHVIASLILIKDCYPEPYDIQKDHVRSLLADHIATKRCS